MKKIIKKTRFRRHMCFSCVGRWEQPRRSLRSLAAETCLSFNVTQELSNQMAWVPHPTQLLTNRVAFGMLPFKDSISV